MHIALARAVSTKGKTVRKRNPQRRKLMEVLAETGSLTKASEAAGYSSNRAAANALSSMRARGELIEEFADRRASGAQD